jgi:hypothetical protein
MLLVLLVLLLLLILLLLVVALHLEEDVEKDFDFVCGDDEFKYDEFELFDFVSNGLWTGVDNKLNRRPGRSRPRNNPLMFVGSALLLLLEEDVIDDDDDGNEIGIGKKSSCSCSCF